MNYVHGGDIYSYAVAHGGQLPIDLSANINPYGIPERALQAMRDAIEQCVAYPDPRCRAAREAIARREHISPDWIYCGAGAADVLDRLAYTLRPASTLLLAPTFAEYERTLREVSFYPLRREENFAVTERILDAITPSLNAVYLCNPNNPTGRTISPPLLREIIERCAKYNIWLVIDECFLDFLPNEKEREKNSSTPYLTAYPKLILLRAYTKIYAAPGVRFGWCMTANPAVIDGLYRAGQPWNVSVIAQACAVAAAREIDFARESAEKIAAERKILSSALCANRLTVYPSDANFLLFHSSDTRLDEKLAERRILIRNCANYRGLQPGDYRVAVKTHYETAALSSALAQILS